MTRRLYVPVPAASALEDLASASRPLGMTGGRTSHELLRETYFDTPDGLLKERRLTLCLQLAADGRRIARLTLVCELTLQGVVEEEALEEPVGGEGLYELLSGPSRLAVRVREVCEPPALRPCLALDIDREVRELKSGWVGRPVFRVFFDHIIVQAPGASTMLPHITVTELAQGAHTLEALARRLQRRQGLRADGLDPFARARDLLEGEREHDDHTPHDVRMALLVLREGQVALRSGPRGLSFPVSRGSGEDVAREFLGDLLGTPSPGGELELVGFAGSGGEAADLEVWIRDGLQEGDAGDGLVWMPLAELMERVGVPQLRDDELVAALLVLARSEVGLRLLREAHPRSGVPRMLPPAPRPADTKVGKDKDDFLDMELSILDFNQRVLELAEDPSVPLLERFRFLSIFASNMDEFFVVRVGRLKAARSAGGADEEDVGRLLDLISIRTRALFARQCACFSAVLLPALAERGIRLRRWGDLPGSQRAALTRRFQDEIFPLLTPHAMSASPGHPFPRLTSLGLSLVAVLQEGEGPRRHLAHVPLPPELPRFLEVPGTRDAVPLEEVVRANADALFPAFTVQGVHPFRVSRLGDVEIDEDMSASFLASVEDEVEARPYKPVVRIEVHPTMPRDVRAHLLRELRRERGTEGAVLTRGDIYEVTGPLDLGAVSAFTRLDIPGGLFAPFEPRRPLDGERSIFEILHEGDVLVHHPYESFDATVGRFLDEAAHDPDVVAIKLTLYRTGRDSPLAGALLDALRQGKEVSVFVELKARFDEESNILWTRRLTEAGGHVVYGLVGFKNHAKTALVVRRERDGIRRYVHIGTGNYNADTARLYTDLGLLSADPRLGSELSDFFNELTGSAGPPVKSYEHLWVAPTTLRPRVLACIEREIEHAKAGRPARIQAKMNGLTERKVIRALYRASCEGVDVDLVVRSICRLRPGVPGLSERIRVRSILGRFLEHGRIYHFANGGGAEYYIGSADWRGRNLRRRVEVVTPVRSPELQARLRTVLDAELDDPRAWILRPDGAYQRLEEEGASAQERFLG